MSLPAQIPAADPAIVGLGAAFYDLIKAIKSKETAMQDVEAVLPDFVAAAADVANLGTEVKKASDQVFLAYAIAAALEGQ